MPLEATMLIIDNSEYMRNGDYQPTRFEAQSDAVTTIFRTKIDSNPENTVGIMTMAGKGPEVLVTNTKELGQIVKAIHDTSLKIGRSIDIPTSIAIAQLALKHRENKNLRQRIIIFVGSPLEGPGADDKAMVKLAKKLKKNNIAVDVVAFGDGIESGDRSVLKTFVEAASSSDNSRYIAVPPGVQLLSDMLLHSQLLANDRGIPEEAMDEAAASGSGAAAGGPSFDFGVDPSLDPELAMALQMSMQEEQARLAAEEHARSAASASAPTASVPVEQMPAASTSAGAPFTAQAQSIPAEPTDLDDDDMLKQAIAMSKGESGGDDEMALDVEGMDEEEAIAKAIEKSMQKGDDKGNQ